MHKSSYYIIKVMPVILSIGGSDSSGIAGIQMDTKICLMLNAYCLSVVTAVTAQNTSSITHIKPIDASIVKAQLDALLNDFPLDAIKVSMLYTRENVNAIADTLEHYMDKQIPIVIDPLLVSSTGTRLLEHDAIHDYVNRIVPIASVITPNILEAEWLASMSINSIDDAIIAAERIARLGAKGVVIKGGHLMYDNSIDIILHDGKVYQMSSSRVQVSSRGLGSIYSTALTVELAKGNDLVTSASIAKNITYNALLNSRKIGKGMGMPTLREVYCSDPVIKELSKAVDILVFTDKIGLLIPESQSNFVFAREDASSSEDVAGIKGRIVRVGDRAVAGEVAYSASRHVADTVLTAMRYEKSVRSAINIRYSDKILEVCRRLSMSISNYDRSKEPMEVKYREGMSITWGIDNAIRSFNCRVPDVIYHKGDIGKEPMIILFGKEPMEVITKIKLILKELGYNEG